MPVYHDLSTEEGLKHFLEMRAQMLLSGKKPVVCFQGPENHRSIPQNNSLWLWAEMCAHFLNDCGLDQRVVLDQAAPIPWTKTAFVDQVWRKVSKAIADTDSTRLPSKTQYLDIQDVIVRHIQESQGVTLPEWPHRESA